jgi:putative membrane protein
MDQLLHDLKPMAMLSTLIYSAIGLILFGVAYAILEKVLPFSFRKEIEEDQNTALAIILGSVFIAMAIIIQAAIRG